MSLTISPPPLLLVVCAYTHVLSNHNPPPPYSPSPTRRQVSYLVTRVTSCWWLSLAYLVVNCLQTCSFSPFPPFYPSPPHLSHPSTPAPTPPIGRVTCMMYQRYQVQLTETLAGRQRESEHLSSENPRKTLRGAPAYSSS